MRNVEIIIISCPIKTQPVGFHNAFIAPSITTGDVKRLLIKDLRPEQIVFDARNCLWSRSFPHVVHDSAFQRFLVSFICPFMFQASQERHRSIEGKGSFKQGFFDKSVSV